MFNAQAIKLNFIQQVCLHNFLITHGIKWNHEIFLRHGGAPWGTDDFSDDFSVCFEQIFAQFLSQNKRVN